MVQDDHKEVVQSHDGKEIAGPGKEIVHLEQLPEAYDEEKGKEVVPDAGKERVTRDEGKEVVPKKKFTVKKQLERRFCGIRAKWWLLGLGLLVLVVIAVGAGVGATVKSKHGNSSSVQDTSAPGALKGTKLAVLYQSFGPTDEQTLVMYFQHHTGSIRWMQRADNGTWVGGDAASNVADDAKSNTAITAVSYTWNGASFWRLYCRLPTSLH